MGSALLRARLRLALDVAAVVATLVFISSYFPANVMFSNTTTNGGDMGTHFYPGWYLRYILLPRGQVTGWCPGNYGGYPLFQFYFPLPFLMMAAGSLVIPFPIAFKLVTQLGTFLLPITAYLSLRLARVRFPGPALGALSTLFFLFMTANSMWGGNIPSTLAGEFTFSIGLALAVLFLGALRRAIDTGRCYAWNALLVALIGLSHGYTLLWAGVSSLAELVVLRGWWRRVGALTAVHGLAILLLGFWIFPLLGYTRWTTAYTHVWFIKSWQEVMPPILWAPAIIAVVTVVAAGLVAAVAREPYPRELATFAGATVVGAGFYFTARSLHVVDIRFLPFMQLGLCLTAAAGLGTLLGRLPTPEVWPVAAALAILPYVQGQAGFIPSWITWNYSGFERKAPWPTLKAISEHLRGDFRMPRVVYEHSPDHEALGTIRTFENLPLFTGSYLVPNSPRAFTGRSTLEGLYFQANTVPPFVFYIQSEVSNVMSCPFSEWGCSRPDLERGLRHLRMFNVSHYIVKSKEMKAAAAARPEQLEREATFGAYEIYRLKENDNRYAIPLAVKPALVLTGQWKEIAYQWFKWASPEDPVPVFATEADPKERQAFAVVADEIPHDIPRESTGPLPPLHEEFADEEHLTITGARPGVPILIRIAYHPRWKVLTGERVWLAAPSFMMVVPNGDRVELVYDGGRPVTIGRLLSAIGLVILLVSLLPVRRPVLSGLRPLLELPPVTTAAALVRWTGGWDQRVRIAALSAALLAVGSVFGAAASASRALDADGLYNKGLKLYDVQRFDEAVALFREAQRVAPLSSTAIHSTFFESSSLFRQSKWAEALKAYQSLLDRFPEAQAAAESMYHVGVCRRYLDNKDGALEAFRETRRRWPDSVWAKYAGERLTEMGEGTGG